jgi:hypothetical protein
MDQTHPDRAVIAPRSEPEESSETRRFRLSRALAGMAVTLAMAVGIVVIDLWHEIAS